LISCDIKDKKNFCNLVVKIPARARAHTYTHKRENREKNWCCPTI